MESNCVFCKIIGRELPARVEYEDDRVIVFHCKDPSAPVHLLAVPKKHIPTVMNVEEADLPVISHIHKIAQEMYRQFKLEGMSMNVNCEEKGGQDVFHVHYHIKGWV
ncbi:HIT domain-containing protein [Paenibacillus glycanilyticus]|uniref:Histidine triad nucleotide-binding protein n=1 Tax=Paenibacillus glycanilyticus TaxID=126569 RepID=A0ABQ6GCI2_9BACL|nr:HIT domain-containing protein [Paenibacillus glycanilyticus]GLX66772.1 histidine triad nucleotide-binding protein [Paenibacillus glycanilyticus]